MKIRALIPTTFLAAAVWLGCSAAQPAADAPSPNATVEVSPAALKDYPDLAALYAGDHGLYRGCGPNNGVCHNSREFPNLASLGSLVQNIGLPCNQKRDDPTQLHDLCERPGDFLRVDGGRAVEIGAVLPYSDSAVTRMWRVRVKEHIDVPAGARVTIVRTSTGKEVELLVLSDAGVTITPDASDPAGRTLIVRVPPPAEAEDDPIAPPFARAGIPGDPLGIQVGDPNQNGVFGATLGGKIIVPGDPARSYLFVRLTDPTAGPVMPRANCCFWTKAALRALYCWVAGLAPDGSNALSPIDYAKCPPGPLDTMEYPSPGGTCETSGLCPVKPKGILSDDPTFQNVYDGVLRQSCAGASCHVGGDAGGLDMTTQAKAYGSLVDAHRVVPGDTGKSLLWQRITPELCSGDCKVMPRGGPPLDGRARSIIERWILGGAKND